LTRRLSGRPVVFYNSLHRSWRMLGTSPPIQSSPNDVESCGSGSTVDNVQAACSMATLASSTITHQSAATSDLDPVPTGSEDSVSYSTQSQAASTMVR